MKKLFALLLVFTMMFGTLSTNAFAAGSSKGSFSGSHSITSGSHSSGSTYSSGKTYSSGVKRPSSNVTPSNRTSSSYGSSQYQQPRSSGWGKFFGGMAAGAIASSLFSHMFHPFGGYYGSGIGYGYHGFSIWSLLIDLLVLYIVFRIVRGIFFRRR